jgi:hypothetical protein
VAPQTARTLEADGALAADLTVEYNLSPTESIQALLSNTPFGVTTDALESKGAVDLVDTQIVQADSPLTTSGAREPTQRDSHAYSSLLLQDRGSNISSDVASKVASPQAAGSMG